MARARSARNSAKSFYSRNKREEEEEEKIEQPEEPMPEPEKEIPQTVEAPVQEEAEAEKPETKPVQSYPTGGARGIPKLNAQQRFEVGQNVADQKTSTKLVEAGELDLLPEALQDRKEELEAQNAAGRLGHAQTKQWSSTGNTITVNPDSIKDVKQLAYFGTTLTDDKSRQKLYETWAKRNGMDLEDLYYQAETMLGDRAFDFPQSAKGQLKYAGLYDAAGNELDIATANPAQVQQAIRMIPPGEYHDLAVKAYKKLYGWTDDTNLEFMDSADLTETKYKAAVKEYNAAFTFSEGATDANTEAYLDIANSIYSDYSNPRVQQQMLRQLANAYESHTGIVAPSVDEIRALEEQEQADEQGDGMSWADKAKAGWDRLANLFAGKGKAKAPEQIEEDVPESAAGQPRSAGGGSSAGAASSYAASSAPEIQGPSYQTQTDEESAEITAMEGAAQETEAQGPAYQPQEEQPGNRNAERYVNRIDYDANMTDAQVLSLWLKGARPDERNMAQIKWVTDNKNVQGLFNAMGMYGDLGTDENGRRNVIDKFSYYGNSIGAASMVIDNGSLPDDVADTAMLALGSVVNEIDRIVADPNSGITIPKGQNMYEYVLSLPQYSGLSEQVEAVFNTQAQANEAYAEQALREEEARQAQLESDRNAILAGNGTPEMAARLAAEYSNEYVDLGDDETRAMYRFQLSERSSFYSDNGTFWNGNSAAAIEGANLRRMGKGYGVFKSSLKNETLSLVDEYATAAIKMGMSLEDYLGNAGITDLSQVIDIAYSGMLERGNAYAKDAEAQEAASGIVTTSAGMWDAAVMGAQHGTESYTADFTQTLYMVMDAADYNTTVLDLQNDYRSKYGDEMAPSMYYADLMAYIDSGALSEESAKDLLDHMGRAHSIFDVAFEIDPGFFEGLARTTHEELQKDVEALEAVAQTLPENERALFNGVSGIAYSIPGMAVSTVTGGVSGSALLGSAVGWGMTGYSSAYDENRAKGMSPGMAGFMALGNAAISTAVNLGGTGTQMDLIFGGSAYQTFRDAVMGRNGKSLIKEIGKELLRKGHEEGVEEVTETVLGGMFDLLDKEALAIDSGAAPSLSRTVRGIVETIEEADAAAIGKELLTNYGMGVAYGGIFSLAGVAKTAIAAKRGVNAQNHYASIDLAVQMADGTVPFTEENIGKVYAAVQKDLEDPRYRRWIDSANMAARDQNATMTAMMMGAGGEQRKTAVVEAQKAQEYEAKAEAARSASQTAQSRWWELRERLVGGDLSVEVELESARMQWQKAETALQEAENAAQKSKERATQSMSEWLKACRAEGVTAKSWELKRRADQIANARMDAAVRLSEIYSNQAQDEEAAEQEVRYAENAVFSEEAENDEEVSATSDDELDVDIEDLNAQIAEAETRIADISSRQGELGIGGDTMQALVEQELAPLSRRKERIIAREKARFNDAFDRMQQALEMDNEDAADQIQNEYDSIGQRLRTLGVDTDALTMEQYGIAPEEANAAYEAAQEQEAQRAADEEYERLTDDLSRRIQATNDGFDSVAAARRYFAGHDIYVNESQAADILAADGVKSIPQFNIKHHTRLTTKRESGAMPLDGHVLSDIASESAGSVQTDADPVSELLRVVQAGKKYAAERQAQRAEAKELAEKRKAADQRRRASVDVLINPIDMSAIPIEENVQKVADMEPVSVLTGNEFPMSSGTVAEDVRNYFKSIGLSVRNDVLGDVQLSNRGVKDSIGHGLGPEKSIAFAAVPEVIANGKIINAEKNWKNRGWDTYVIAAPIKIVEGKSAGDYLCGVIVKRASGTQGYYLHEVILADENKEGASAPFSTGSLTKSGEESVGTESPSMNMILERVLDVKRNEKNNRVVNQNPNVDAMAAGGSSYSPQQTANQLSKKGQKLEMNALKAVQDLADTIGVGFHIKSDARFQSADARMGKGVAGYYKNGQRNALVRSKEAGRLEVSGHEIGHAVQEQLGMRSTQKMVESWQKNFPNTGAYAQSQYDHEAFAEFFWRYLKGRDVAVTYTDDATVDTFEYALRKNKKLRKAVEKAQERVSTYFNSSDTGARIQANIVSASEANKDTPFLKTAVSKIVDDTAAVETMQNVIRERTGEDHLDYSLNLRDTIRYNRRASGRAEQCVSTAMVDNDGNVVGESLTDVFSEVKGKDYDLYMQWWLARQSLDRDKRKGKDSQVFAESDIATAERQKFIAETEKAHPEFARTNARLQKWRRLFLDTYLVNNGLMGDPARATALLDALEQIYPYYAPTKRAGKGGLGAQVIRGAKGQKTYKMHEATGSTETIIDPFESFVGMVNSVVSLVAENDNRKKFAELYDTFSSADPGNPGAGMGLFANEITQDMQKNVVDVTELREKIEQILDDIGTDPDMITQISDLIGDERAQYRGKGRVDMDSVIRVRGEDGKDRYFEVYNPEMFELLANVSGQSGKADNGLLKFVGGLTRAMSMLTTGSNPVFGITNAIRDFQNSVSYGSWATSYIDGAAKWLATLGDVVTNSEVSQEYDALGGGGWSQYDTRTKRGAERTRSGVFKGYNRKNIGQIGKTAGRVLWRIATMEDLNGAIEKTSRLAEYKYGKHDRTSAEGRIEAFLAAQDVTTDFARHGSGQVAKDLKYFIPFFNASMQGVYRTARQFTKQEGDRAKIRLAKQITNTALTSLLANGLLMAYLDDDEKEEFTYLSEDLTIKHMFLPNFAPDILGDAMLIRIPLDQNPLSYAINAAVSNMVWKGETGDDFLVSMAALSDVIMDNLNPVSSTILDPVVSVMSNKNWYGSKIVPTYLESYDALNQYTEETPEAFVLGAELLSGVTGGNMKISPMMLQYLAEQYTGYVGQTLIPALPSERNRDGVVTGMWNALVATTRKRVTSDPLKSNDVISQVYDSFTEMQAVSKAGKSKRDFEIDYLKPTLTDREKRRAIDEAYDLTHSGGELYEAKKELAALDDEIDEINARDDLTDHQKYLLISEVRKEKIEIALDAQETMNDYDARYRYEGILPSVFARMLSD